MFRTVVIQRSGFLKKWPIGLLIYICKVGASLRVVLALLLPLFLCWWATVGALLNAQIHIYALQTLGECAVVTTTTQRPSVLLIIRRHPSNLHLPTNKTAVTDTPSTFLHPFASTTIHYNTSPPNPPDLVHYWKALSFILFGCVGVVFVFC